MFRNILLTVLVLASGVVTYDAMAQERTWTSADGAFTVEAELIRLDGQTVYLRRADNGREIAVKLSQLSSRDRRFAREQTKNVPGSGRADQEYLKKLARPASTRDVGAIRVVYAYGGAISTADKYRETLEESITSTLSSCGFRVETTAEAKHAIVLQIKVNGAASGGLYKEVYPKPWRGHEHLYTGASIRGEITLEDRGRQVLSRESFSGTVPIKKKTMGRPTEQGQAPFFEAHSKSNFPKAFVSVIHEQFGADPLIALNQRFTGGIIIACDIRDEAEAFLFDFPAGSIRSVLVASLKSRSRAVRTGAARLLSDQYLARYAVTEDVLLALRRSLRDEEAAVRQHCLNALSNAKCPLSFDEVEPFLSDTDAAIRRAAVRALPSSPDKKVIPRLATMLLDDALFVSSEAASSLACFPEEPAAREAILEALRDNKNTFTRQCAARALGRFNDPRDIPLLKQYALTFAASQRHEERCIAKEAVESLSQINDPEASKALKSLQQQSTTETLRRTIDRAVEQSALTLKRERPSTVQGMETTLRGKTKSQVQDIMGQCNRFYGLTWDYCGLQIVDSDTSRRYRAVTVCFEDIQGPLARVTRVAFW
jgi:hypothetical protein